MPFEMGQVFSRSHFFPSNLQDGSVILLWTLNPEEFLLKALFAAINAININMAGNSSSAASSHSTQNVFWMC